MSGHGPARLLQHAQVLVRLHKYGHAAREARRAIRLAPNDPEAHRLLAMALCGQKKLTQARTSAETAVHLAPENAGAHSTLAMVLSASGSKRDARKHHEQAIALDPDRAWFHTCYARFLLDVHRTSLSPRRDLERSWSESGAALQMDPSDVDAHLVRASILYLERRLDEAEASARAALEVEPNLARAHEVLGDIYFSCHQSAQAYRCLREALRLNPSNRWLKRKTIRSLQDELPVLGAVWRFARHRTRISNLFWLLYVLVALLTGLASALLGTERAALVFQFALYVPVILMVLFFAILMGIDLVITFCVTSGWIKI